MKETVTTELPMGQKPRPSRLREAPLWHAIQPGWRPLYGSYYELGLSVEWHDFQLSYEFDWSRSFHPESLELCLNVAGNGSIRQQERALDFESLTAGFYSPGEGVLQGRRAASQQHQFITVEFSRGFLRSHLSRCDGALHPLVEAFVQGGPTRAGVGEIRRLSAAQEQLAAHLVHPTVYQAARPLWYQSKVLGLMVDFFFERRGDDELFCDRQKRLARERVDRVIAILRQRLTNPPELQEIGRRVGCSPFHLSRTFSGEMHMTIPQYVRKLRMERAAELLQSGKYNVTEAAMEVGYSSLSHFSQAFCQTMGRCPGLYPLKTPQQSAAKESQSTGSASASKLVG
jgi:AraC-like DNA-binding protein